MYCPNCGKDAGESKFCPECGASLNQQSSIKPSQNRFNNESVVIRSEHFSYRKRVILYLIFTLAFFFITICIINGGFGLMAVASNQEANTFNGVFLIFIGLYLIPAIYMSSIDVRTKNEEIIVTDDNVYIVCGRSGDQQLKVSIDSIYSVAKHKHNSIILYHTGGENTVHMIKNQNEIFRVLQQYLIKKQQRLH